MLDRPKSDLDPLDCLNGAVKWRRTSWTSMGKMATFACVRRETVYIAPKKSRNNH